MKQLQIDASAVYRRGQSTPILRDLGLSCPAGRMTAILGRNGAGKSTLLYAIAGLLPYTGHISYDGTTLDRLSPVSRAKLLALMEQHLRAPHITVETLIGFGRTPHLSLSDRYTDNDRQAIADALSMAELDAIRSKYLDAISGGELRRAYLGMALAQNTPILLLDEATAHMDMDYEASFLARLSALAHDTGRTVISVMHSLHAAVRYADHIIVLDRGTAVFSGTPDAFCAGDIPQTVFGAQTIHAEDRTFFAVDR